MNSKSRAWTGALALCGAAIIGCSANAAPDGQPIDYLVQDVCIDAKGVAIGGDPASCARRRDLKVGEPQRYLLTDYDRASGTTFQASSSVPVRGTDGRTMVLLIKNLEGSFGPNYRFSFSPARDAFDLVDVSHSGYASIVRTFDGGCLDQILSLTALEKPLPIDPAAGSFSRFARIPARGHGRNPSTSPHGACN